MIGLLLVLAFITVNASIAPLIGLVQGKSLVEWWRS